ncbi:MAG: ankyrin repeat domain-containing protein [Synergistaceae bacterium]|jgi:ankyrin repeat protein|nr:ankyrin repeat domain-containing protein [Synergistaceae bacterium]
MNKSLSEDFIALCQRGTPKEVRKAIDAGVDVNAKDEDGLTPLMYAVRDSGDPEVVSALLKAGADVNAKDNTGRTPLTYANTSGVIHVLLGAGAEVDARDEEGNTPLMHACDPFDPDAPFGYAEFSDPEVVSALLKGGADVNAKNIYGWTPLMCAAWEVANHFEVISILLKAGADVNTKSVYGETALMGAAKYASNPEVISAMLKVGADVNARASDDLFSSWAGLTPLMHAADTERYHDSNFCEVGDYEYYVSEDVGAFGVTVKIISALINAGADVNAKDSSGRTPLMHVALNDSSPTVAELDAEADGEGDRMPPIDATHIRRVSPDCYLEEVTRVISALLNAGADASAKDNDGHDALFYATKNEALKDTSVIAVLRAAASERA